MSAAVVEERDEDEVPALAAAAAETAQRTEKRRGRSGCLIAGATALLIPTLVVGTVCGWIYLQDRWLAEEALARARAAGDPLTAEEFQAAFYPPSEEIDEATRRWILATEAIQRSWKAPLAKDLPDVGLYGPGTPGVKAPAVDERGLYTDPTLSTVDQFFAEGGEEAVAAIRAARRTDVPPRIACDLSGKQELELEQGGLLFVSQSLLVLEAERKAARDDLDAAIEALVSIVAMSEAIAGDASLHAIGRQTQCHRWACLSIRRMIERVDFSDAQLARLDEALAASDLRERLVRHLQAEQRRVVWAIESDEPTGDVELDFFSKFPLRGADEGLAVENFQDLLDGAKIDFESAQAALDQVNARLRPIQGSPQSIRYEIAIRRAIEADCSICIALQAEADRRLTRTLLACERYRLKHGAWPADLQSLPPEFVEGVPQDVVGGKPVGFVVAGDRLKLGSEVTENPMSTMVGKGPVEITIEKPRDASTKAAAP